MPKTQCPHCQATFKLKDESLIGQVRPCAKCGKKFRVQDMDEFADEEIEEPVAPTRGKKMSKGKKKSGGNGLLMVIGGGVAVACLLVGIYFAFLRGGAGSGVGGLLPGGQSAEATALDLKENSRRIGLACYNFNDTFEKFPHPEVGPDGKSGLSWRVHILPYLDQKSLYDQFHLDEPWDSSHNKTLVDKMPAFFQTPGVSETGKTAWHMFTGPGSPGAKGPFKLRDILDGPSNTILAILGGPESATEWTKPGGIPFNASNPLQPLGTPYDGTFPVVMFDGRAMKLKSQTPIADIAALIGSQDATIVAGDPFEQYAVPKPTGMAVDYPGLSQVARACFGYWETNHRFAAAKMNGGLSWRVAILPLIGQQELYGKFHLNEPWDSPHNKALVAEMPSMYKTPGVDGAGQTSLHVVDDPAAPFGVSGGVEFKSLTDGSSNILMVLIAGPEVATEWTRPGGLPFDPSNPVSAWGSPQAGVYPTAAFDGSLKALRADAPAAQVALYVQHADNKPVDKTIFLSP